MGEYGVHSHTAAAFRRIDDSALQFFVHSAIADVARYDSAAAERNGEPRRRQSSVNGGDVHWHRGATCAATMESLAITDERTDPSKAAV